MLERRVGNNFACGCESLERYDTVNPRQDVPKKSTLRQFVIKNAGIMHIEKLLKATKEKTQTIYKETTLRPTAGFLPTAGVRDTHAKGNILQMLKGKRMLRGKKIQGYVK